MNPLGNETMGEKEEKALRRSIIDKALEALATDLKEQKMFK
jgi:hypothetical protein